MKIFVKSAAIVSVIGLLAASVTGCATTPGSTTSPAATLQTFITDVQAIAQTACSFVPTADTVANIVAANDSQLGTAEAVATAICTAVANSPPATTTTASAAQPMVDGVVVRGTFLGK